MGRIMETTVYKSSEVKATHFLIVVHSEISRPEVVAYMSESEVNEVLSQFEATGMMKDFSFPTLRDDRPIIAPLLAYKVKIEKVATYRPKEQSE